MKRHVDPFPATSDLFAGLLIATFGGLVLFSEFTGHGNAVDGEARRLTSNAQQILVKHLHGNTRECGGDLCVDVEIRFPTDSSNVPNGFARSLADACAALKPALRDHRDELQISIEGHTDSRVPQQRLAARDRFLYNWDLSARRASSVLYEFKSCGLDPISYRIVALGYADTQPLCIGGTEADDPCNARNRRTTFRLRPDREKIAQRLSRRAP